jgi:hypothetical protein
MKLQVKIMASAVLLAASFTLTTSRLPAADTNVVSVNLTIESQGSTNTSGGVITVASPKTTALNIKQLLAWLAVDEYAEGNYPSNSFPGGAYLASITAHTNVDYQVLTKSNAFLVDVSDIIQSSAGSNSVYSGKVKISTGLFSPSKITMRLTTAVYDDSGIVAVNGRPVVGLNIFLVGLQTKTVTDSTPSKSGAYTETISDQAPSVVGEGVYNGTPVLVTGSFGSTSTTKRQL